MFRMLMTATALLGSLIPVFAQSAPDSIAAPVLRANVTVSSDIVRIGDVIDNAGGAAQIAIFRAPNLGTTGTLPVRQLLSALRAHQVIGVDTRQLHDISVTRAARTIDVADIERQIALALERRNGLGDAANLSLTIDRDVQPLQLDAANSGPLQLVSAKFEPRNNRFDVAFEISSDTAPTIRLRFTGTAIETVEAAVLARAVDRNDVLKSSDVMIERRPKSEVGADMVPRERALGMQTRRQMRFGQALRMADLAKPDLVQRDQAVTLIYDSAGLYLTIRGKALEGGTEGDVVNVLNLQSKRTVSGVVVGRGQIAIAVATPRPTAVSEIPSPVAVAAIDTSVPRKAE